MQRKGLGALSLELGLPSHQVQAMFNKAVRRLSACLRGIEEEEVEEEMAAATAAATAAAGIGQGRKGEEEEGGRKMESLPMRLEEEMEMGAKEAKSREREGRREVRRAEGLLKSLDLMQYAVKGSTEEWEEVLKEGKGALQTHGMVQLKSLKKTGPSVLDQLEEEEAGGEEGGGKKKRRMGGGEGGRTGRCWERGWKLYQSGWVFDHGG